MGGQPGAGSAEQDDDPPSYDDRSGYDTGYANQAGNGYGGSGGRRGSRGGQRGAFVAVAILIVLLLGGGIAAAVALSGGSGDDDNTAPPVGTTQGADGTAGTTTPGGAAPGPGVTSPQQSPSPSLSPSPSPSASASASPVTLSTDDAATLVRNQGYEPDMSTYQEDRQLSVVIGTAPAAGDTPRQLAFVFADGKYRGTDTSAPSAHIAFRSQRNDHEVVLRYDTYNPQDPISSPSGHADVRSRWTGTSFITRDPIPSNDPNVAGSRR
ncbi:LppP/LprE family lipoprotein [Frankia tisae]|uniref:LppP/LprE family lipoprotein n=1 Tax=Frankia tisae TaxID=2950104 RepID=UPI0021C19233|nr:LppP/LprE family lipoprotein [Frankia tisae]